MSNKLINLKLTSDKNCFLSIPRSWRDEIQQKVSNLKSNLKILVHFEFKTIETFKTFNSFLELVLF